MSLIFLYAAEPPHHVQHLIIQWFFIRHHIIDPAPPPPLRLPRTRIYLEKNLGTDPITFFQKCVTLKNS
jgi:hypothetical protein